LTVTQALLRGFGTRANLASLRQAELDTLSSEYELRGFAESLVAQVEATYWDYALAERQIEIYTQSLKLAEDQLTETVERIETGALAETELAAAQAEVALRREDLINARSSFATVRLRLLRLLNPPGTENWERDIVLQNQPIVLDTPLDEVVSHVQVALRMRPELNQALLGVKRGDLEIVKTRNGLLPKMDLFITLGKSGYANSFGRSFRELDGDNYDFLVGFTFEYPLANRDAEARHQRAVLTRKQSVEAVGNLTQLVELDVRSAYIEVDRASEQVAATGATRKLQEEKLRAETEKFRVGKSTSLLVAQAQRDLVASQISEIQAVVNHLKALVELYRLEGSLLERRGISAPGREPFALSLGQ
jgi:outer membrane protein TolC